MKVPEEIKILTKIFPKINRDLKHISKYAEENPDCNYFFFGPQHNIEDEP